MKFWSSFLFFGGVFRNNGVYWVNNKSFLFQINLWNSCVFEFKIEEKQQFLGGLIYLLEK